MEMSDRDHALQLLEMAADDQRALAHMTDAEVFTEGVFGFHAQQAVEKALKAWTAALRAEYPMTHNIAELLDALEERGADVRGFASLEGYTAFAVQYRYEAFNRRGERFHRPKVVDETAALISHVQDIIDRSAP